MMNWRTIFAGLTCFTIVNCAALFTTADDFVQFRGANAGAIADQAIPLTWSATENLAWKASVPGAGWSQPIVWKNRLYVTTAVADPELRPKNFADGVKMPQSMGLGGFSGPPKVNIDWQLICLDADSGQLIWKQTIISGKPEHPIHPSNTYATESPAVDEHGIVVFFGATGTLASISHAGQQQWQQDLGAYPSNNGFGTGSSLAIDAGKVFVQHFTSKSGIVVCVDVQTGTTKWKHERTKMGSSWSSPIVWRNSQRREVIVAGNDEVDSLDPENGAVLWKLQKVKAPTACSVAADSERLYFGGSDPFAKGPLFALSAGSSGDLTPEKMNGTFAGCAWSESKAGPGMASPVSNGQFLYVTDNNILRCYDAKTGERLYQNRLPDMKLVAASPLIVGNKLLVVDEAGVGALVKVGKEFEVVGGGKIEDVFWSTPAVANQSLYLRGIDGLYCIRKTAKDQ